MKNPYLYSCADPVLTQFVKALHFSLDGVALGMLANGSVPLDTIVPSEAIFGNPQNPLPLLICAVEFERMAVVAALFDLGVDVNVKVRAVVEEPGEMNERGAVAYAIQLDNPRILKLLHSRGASMLSVLRKTGPSELDKRLLARGLVPLYATEIVELSALLLAIRECRVDVIDTLLGDIKVDASLDPKYPASFELTAAFTNLLEHVDAIVAALKCLTSHGFDFKAVESRIDQDMRLRIGVEA